MSWNPQTLKWPKDQAVLFVHGIGNAKPGDYDYLLREFDASLGPAVAGNVAKYMLYYDDVNDWMADKVNLAGSFAALTSLLKSEATQDSDPALGAAVAEFAGDVILPILNEAARVTVRDRILAQLLRLRLDGVDSGVGLSRQRISIVCHSMGCFHTYEALHAAAAIPTFKLMPISDLMRFRSVLFMASPVQLIRTVAGKLGSIVPKAGLAALSDAGLYRSFEADRITGKKVPCAANWVSITGDLDPVGGHFFKFKAAWATMSMEGQISRVDDQSALNVRDRAELAGILADIALRGKASPQILRDPHSWSAYIRNHSQEISQWIA